MQSFAYVAPDRLEQALAELSARHHQGQRTQLLAGGTDLLVQMRGADREPRVIVDVKKLPETTRVVVGPDAAFIGAAVPAIVLTANAEFSARFPGLVEAIDLIGSAQIQGRASVGGNLCNASPAGDTIPALIVNRGTCMIARAAGAPGGADSGAETGGEKGGDTIAMRELPVEEFVVGVGRNALQPGELLLGIRLPAPAARTGDAYLRFIPRTEMDIAVASAGVSVTLDADGICTAARVAIGAVAPTALLVPEATEALVGARLGGEPDSDALEAAGRACSAAARPISDKRGTDTYRRKVVSVLCRRAVAIAAQRASSDSKQGARS
jgi:CO/xanthine dehydrogenase FAD-binding subunit